MQKHHRGERRFQTERLKKKRQFYWGYSPDSPFEETQVMSTIQLSRVVQNPAICSCGLCGHAARGYYGNGWEGKTVQELSDLEVIRKHLV